MALARDDSAASPLVVITTFVLAAVLVTIVVYAVAFDRPEPGLAFVAARGESGALSFDVTQVSGGLSWDEVTLRLLDRAGTDLGEAYLRVPEGEIEREQRVGVEPLPPAGTYLLLAFLGDEELSRLSVTL